MKVVCVDDESIMLQGITRICKEIHQFKSVVGFESSEEALEYILENDVDLVFLDIDMPIMNGLELGKRIKQKKPFVHIIFVTGYSEYSLDAFKIHATGYLVKPVDKEDVLDEVRNILHNGKVNSTSGIVVKTFGNFEVFIDSVPISFERSKTKELFAYLIDRGGAVCTNNEIMAILWDDDDDHLAYFKKLRSDLFNTLKKIGYQDVVIKRWGGLAVDTSMVSCDYYDWKVDVPEAIKAFNGEYMSQYSWAEGTLGAIMNRENA